jgi:probable O-glycosylation ligase (exosortase A-associated)
MMFGALFLFVPLAFSNAFSGYLLWGWAGLIAMNSYLNGFMVSVPFAQLFALLTLAALLLGNGDRLERIDFNRTAVLMALFVLQGFFVALFAYPGLGRNWELFSNVAKTVLFCLLMPMLVTSRYRMHALVVMVVLAISFHGALDGLKFIASGGAHNARGIAKFGDNNHFALVLLMVLPLIYYLFVHSARLAAKIGFGLVLPLISFAVVATASRGALIGLVVIVAWILLKSRNRMIGLVLVAISAAVVVQLAPVSWSERMETIKSADQDDSFMGRVEAWKVSSAIAVANPVLGGGFRAVQSGEVWTKFRDQPGLLGFLDIPTNSVRGLAAHSIWFEVMGDTGFLGFLLFVALFVNGFFTRRDIQKSVRVRGREDLQWAIYLSDMLWASLLAYLVSGSLLSAAYFELPYILLMMLEVVKQQVISDGFGTKRRSATLPVPTTNVNV